QKGQSGLAKVRYTAGALSLETSTIVVDPASIIADGKATSTVTVSLMDHYGNPVDGNARVIRLLGLELGTLQSGMNYQGNGQFTGTIHSVNEGVDTLGFEVIGAGLGEKHAELTYTAGAYDLTQSTITAAPSLITADGEAKSVVT